MSDNKPHPEQTNRGDTHAAPMRDDTKMSAHDPDETAAADTVAEDVGEGGETGIMHSPINTAGQAGPAAGTYATMSGGVGQGAGIYPVDLDPTDNAGSTVANEVNPELSGVKSGGDQDAVDAADRDVADRADDAR